MAKGSGGVGKGGAKVSGGASGKLRGAAAADSGLLTPAKAAEMVESAYMGLTDGASRQRVMLADLRPKLGLTREDFDSTLKSMQQQGKVTLVGMDNPMEITKRVKDGAINVAGYERHAVYFRE